MVCQCGRVVTRGLFPQGIDIVPIIPRGCCLLLEVAPILTLTSVILVPVVRMGQRASGQWISIPLRGPTL